MLLVGGGVSEVINALCDIRKIQHAKFAVSQISTGWTFLSGEFPDRLEAHIRSL